MTGKPSKFPWRKRISPSDDDSAKDKRIVAIEVFDTSKRTTRKPLDLISLAIVKSSGSDAVREKGETYGGKGKGEDR